MTAFVPLGRDWKKHLADLIRESQKEIIITAPYITSEGLNLIRSNLPTCVREAGQIQLLTDLSPMPICQGATDPQAILEFQGDIKFLTIYHLKRMHAKVYVSDSRHAIVTSGNLTSGGLYTNYEYGLGVTDEVAVTSIRRDILDYMRLGAPINREQLGGYCAITAQVRGAFHEQLRNLSRKAGAAFERVVRRAEDELLRVRLARGPMHTVFADAVLYLLKHEGSLSTQQIHGFVQSLYPDLCDDSVDRVIDGQHFGKKWKHAVRTSQQHLKKQELIEYRDGLWHAVVE